MNVTRFRYWFLSVPITIAVVGVMIEWAIYTRHDTSFFYAIAGFIGLFVLIGSIFGGEKLYQIYKER
jgi:hypothetical protein